MALVIEVEGLDTVKDFLFESLLSALCCISLDWMDEVCWGPFLRELLLDCDFCELRYSN